jgi:NTE family protein
MTSEKGATAFVFMGGGSLGAVQVGMLRALMKAGERPDFVVGASVGAINGAYFAGAPTSEGVEKLIQIWCVLRRAQVFPITLKGALAWLRRSDNIVDPAPLRSLIEANLPFANLEQAAIPLHIVATDIQGLPAVLSHGSAVEAILASAAIPGVFPMVSIDGVPLMDGAIAARSAVRLAVELGASKVIVLQTGYACALTTPPAGAVASAIHAITLLISWRLMHDLETLSDDIGVHVAPSLCPLSVSPFDFSRSGELIERAARSTERWVEDGGLRRRSRPQELAPHYHFSAATSVQPEFRVHE